MPPELEMSSTPTGMNLSDNSKQELRMGFVGSPNPIQLEPLSDQAVDFQRSAFTDFAHMNPCVIGSLESPLRRLVHVRRMNL